MLGTQTIIIPAFSGEVFFFEIENFTRRNIKPHTLVVV
jgi:hypothetical protein